MDPETSYFSNQQEIVVLDSVGGRPLFRINGIHYTAGITNVESFSHCCFSIAYRKLEIERSDETLSTIEKFVRVIYVNKFGTNRYYLGDIREEISGERKQIDEKIFCARRRKLKK